jgi:hypothetical protein
MLLEATISFTYVVMEHCFKKHVLNYKPSEFSNGLSCFEFEASNSRFKGFVSYQQHKA